MPCQNQRPIVRTLHSKQRSETRLHSLPNPLPYCHGQSSKGDEERAPWFVNKPNLHRRSNPCADDLRTIAESKEAVKKQASVISTFAKAVKLKLNSSKVEVLRISRKKHDPEVIQLGDIQLPITSAVKCLGVWWQYNLSASRAVLENISKARKAFFAL